MHLHHFLVSLIRLIGSNSRQPHLFDAETAVTHVVILTGINVPQAETFSLQKRNTLATVDRRNNR